MSRYAPQRKELCRNFQSGSCRFGDRCKFVHANQQQPKPNIFGFGTQTGTPSQQTSIQHQKPNPFGFGVQNSGPANGTANAGGFGQPNTFKPFQNKWNRSEQPANQSQAANHECTNPDNCKKLIAEDFERERPLWKLTCYGHYKHLPCDITGDISYEELQAEAYSDAKRGLSLQSIVERERNLLNSKLAEFQNLLRNPLTKHTQPAQSNHSPFPVIGSSSPTLTPQNSGPSPFSGFGGQQGSSANMTFGVRPSTPSNNAFGQFQGPGPFGSSSVPSGPFGTQAPVHTSNVAGGSGMSTQSTQFPTQMGGNPFLSNMPGLGNSGLSSQSSQFPTQIGGNSFTSNSTQFPVQTGGNPITSNISGFGNSGMSSQGSQLPSTSSISPQIQPPAINQSPSLSNGLGATNVIEQRNNAQLEVSPLDTNIWLKEEWKLGEIPEQPPPAAYVK